MQSSTTTHGYILLYTILAASLFSVVATSVLVSTLRELEISEQSIEAAKARWAAEAGVECIQYWDRQENPSLLSTEGAGIVSLYCQTESGAGVKQFSKPSESRPDCEPWSEENIIIDPIFIGSAACADVTVTVAPLPNYPTVCKVQITSRGYNDCATKDVERIVWTDEF